MAFEITLKTIAFPPLTAGLPKAHFELADQTADSAAQDALVACRHWRAVIYQKAFTAGTGTRFVQYTLEVADNTGFTTAVRGIATGMVLRADEQTLVLLGQTPFVAGQQFARINVTLDGTDAATYDAYIDAA